MRFPRFHSFLLAAAMLAMPALVFADYTYQETSQITGGSILKMIKMAGVFSSDARKAGDPIVSTVYLKGNRLARVSPEQIEIIDLDKETITNIDPPKRTYTVMTFQQMKDAMERAMQQAKQEQAAHPSNAAAENPDAKDVKMSFDVHVRNTGVEKQVSGLGAKEAILTMLMKATNEKTQQSGSMAITNDMWMVPDVPGYEQVRAFYKRMGEKMGPMFSGMGMSMMRTLAQQPGATQALSDMRTEMEKLKGVPVMQIMRMGATTDGKPLPAASEAPLPSDSSPAMPSASEVAKKSATSAITSRLGGFGGFGGFGKKKQATEPAQEQTVSQTSQAAPTSTVLMESQVTTSEFSSGPVDESHFQVPAGYKQLQTQMR